MRTLVHEEVDHAAFGPSSFERAEICPASMDEGPRREGSTVYADEGTTAHVLLARCLLHGEDTFEWLGADVTDSEGQVLGTVDSEIATHVDTALTYVRENFDPEGMEIETRLMLAGTGMFGHADVLGRLKSGVRAVADLKYGMVEVPGNTAQLGCYLLMDLIRAQVKLNDVPPDTILGQAIVLQPRLMGGAPIKTYDWTAEALLKLLVRIQSVERRRKLFHKQPPVYVAGDHCRWCRRAPFCPKLRAMAKDVALSEIVPMPEDVAEGRVSRDDLEEAIAYLPAVEKWVKAVRETITAYGLAGGSAKGLKVVAGRSSRDWADPEDAAHYIGSFGVEPYETQILSPAKAEKALPNHAKGDLKDKIVVTPGRPRVALEHEPGKPIQIGTQIENAALAMKAQRLLDKKQET